MRDEKTRRTFRVGVIGHGAIGTTIIDLLAQDAIEGCWLAGVLDRQSDSSCLETLISKSDVIVEAAGHEAVVQHGPAIVSSGVDLIVLSVGALIDEGLSSRLRNKKGRLLISAGAIGGLELLRAAALLGPLYRVSLLSTKRSQTLVQPWMDAELVDALREGSKPIRAFVGSAREAASRFPSSSNIAATLGLATIGIDAVEVEIVGDPATDLIRHTVRANGAAGDYEITIQNSVSQESPNTSAITPYAVVRALLDLSAKTVIGV